jgi:hypothetical protein
MRKAVLCYCMHDVPSSHSTQIIVFFHMLVWQEEEVLGRIEASLEDPLGLEYFGHALYDMYPERRGNLFADEVYRLVKAPDATQPDFPVSSKFSNNDVILLTVQPMGSGDIFDPKNLPVIGGGSAVSAEARVIATGPAYVDIVMPAGAFEANFGPAPNNDGPSGKGNPRLRLRVDRFFSEIPYKRMVEAVTAMSTIPQRTEESRIDETGENDGKNSKTNSRTIKEKSNSNEGNGTPYSNICMDEILREAIISTHAFSDPSTPMFHDVDVCDLQTLSRQLEKPPMPSSIRLANQVLTYVQANKHIFNALNGPQLAAIGAALTRKLTLIQGPPGTGKVILFIICAFASCVSFLHMSS